MSECKDGLSHDEMWTAKRGSGPVATGRGGGLVVGLVVTIDNGTACVSGCDAQGKRASRWCDPKELRHADEAEAEMHAAWQGLELYRDVFPDARVWLDANTEVAP
jgi:hypothetical protein